MTARALDRAAYLLAVPLIIVLLKVQVPHCRSSHLQIEALYQRGLVSVSAALAQKRGGASTQGDFVAAIDSRVPDGFCRRQRNGGR
jgi:hypothetical protein